MTTRVYLFKPCFARLVEAGTKRTTVRAARKHKTKIGDVLSLREWTGKPYRSKQRILCTGERCLEARAIEICFRAVPLCLMDGKAISGKEWDEIARMDGFSGWDEMYCWFSEEHGLPFEGEWIRW